MKKLILISLIILSTSIELLSQSGSFPGSFARLGFGARGMAKGNAMVSDIFGDVSGYYNPALACFQNNGIVNVGYTFMSLDRRLNFVGFNKSFFIPNMQNGGAGISLSWINSGVGNIDGRDNDARQIGTLSTFENQFYLGTSFLLDKDFAIGVGFKLYYAKLYDQITTNSVAFDLGALYRATPDLSFGFTVRDISAKYKWETSKVYGANGKTTENKFPTLLNLGASYKLPKNLGVASLELEAMFTPKIEDKENFTTITPKKYYYLKLGTEINFGGNLFARAGLDRIGLNEDDFSGSLKPSFGLGFQKNLNKDMFLGIDYVFQLEPYSHEPIQNINLIFKFK